MNNDKGVKQNPQVFRATLRYIRGRSGAAKVVVLFFSSMYENFWRAVLRWPTLCKRSRSFPVSRWPTLCKRSWASLKMAYTV